MRIAMLAPISHRIPPAGYGPWEQVASDLSNGLVQEGHEVVLFAAEGSETGAELVATVPHPLEEWPHREEAPDPRVWEEIHIATMAGLVAEGGYDIVHSHLHVHALGYAPLLPVPLVTTLHGVAWNRATHPALSRYRDLPFVSISQAERRFFPDLHYVATVHNGIDCDQFTPGPGNGGYLLFAGRMAPEKGPHLAIAVARESGHPIKLAGMIEPRYRDYFEAEVRPGLDGTLVEYLGDVDRAELASLYRQARAVLVPLRWDEPFGLVVAESLASGTPVIGWNRGAIPELIEDEITGAVVADVAGAVAAVARIDEFDRSRCRHHALTRFSVATMTEGYLSAYRQVVTATG